MLNPSKCSKYVKQRDEVMNVICALDDLPDDPNTWSAEQRDTAKALILRLGAPESFLRRFARGELA